MKQLLDKITLSIPKAGDLVNGKVIYLGKNEIHIDIPGFRTGIVRGPELESSEFADELKVGDEVESTIIDLENERGLLELSFRFIAEKRAWDKLEELRVRGDVVSVKITEANKGGLIAKINGLPAFMPVSQLSQENYPRISGADPTKILEKLRSFVNKTLNVQVITVDPTARKLIISERQASEVAQRQALAKFKVGDRVEGEITKLADYGAFVTFDAVEGFLHLSEISWGHVEMPSEVYKVGDKVAVEIIGIDGARVSLSAKRLTPDPWISIGEKFKVGDIVRGKVLKTNPFGLFVEIAPETHGLAHISELGEGVKDPSEVAKPGDELDFKIIVLEPENHRLNLSLKAIKEPSSPQKSE